MSTYLTGSICRCAFQIAERRVHESVGPAGEERKQAERELADVGQTV
ncbi:hypothetical protein [uncultured Thiodictyon sp.]|nr:hypothetical protein [uncultured Thiodictyon sp.]